MLSISSLPHTHIPPLDVNRHISYETAFEKMKEVSEDLFFPKGQLLFNEGNIARGLYIIKYGLVKVVKHGTDGKEYIIRIAGKNDSVGYKGLLTGNHCTSSAIVLSDAQLLFMPADVFKNFIGEYQVIADHYTQLMCEDIDLLENKTVSMAYKPVRGRLAETLLELGHTFATCGASKGIIELSREELANVVGTAKETVIRLLSEFRAENLVEIDGKGIKLTNVKGIEKIIHLYQ